MPTLTITEREREREPIVCVCSVLVLVFSVASCLAQDAGLDYVDDFSCPDELEGYYPHLYRYQTPVVCKEKFREFQVNVSNCSIVLTCSPDLSPL